MLKNAIRFAAGSMSWALIFILVVVSARILGPQEFGRFAFALAYAYLLDPLLDAGFYRLTLRKVSRRPAAAGLYLGTVLMWKIGVGLAVLALLRAGFLPSAVDPRVSNVVFLMVAAGILRSVSDSIRSMLVAKGRLVRDVMSLGLERTTLFLVGVVVLQSGGGLTHLCGAFLAVRALSLVWVAFIARGQVGPLAFGPPRFLSGALKSGAVVSIAAVTAALCGHVDTVIVGALRSAAEVGWYSAAHWTRAALLIVPGVLGALLIPALSRRHHEDPSGFETIFGGGVKYACAAGMAITANGLLLAPALMNAIFGEGYALSSEALLILLLGLPAVFGSTFLQGSLLTIPAARRVLAISVAGLGLNVALNLWLVPRHGFLGAAAATSIAETALFLGTYALVRRRLPGVAPAVFLKAPASLVAAAVGAWALSGRGLVVQLAAANAVFAVALLFSGFVGAAERRALLRGLVSAFRRAPAAPLLAPETVNAE